MPRDARNRGSGGAGGGEAAGVGTGQPAGIIEKASVDPAKRIASLDGKTIALRWNSKHNGDVVLNRLAELLAKKYPSATIVKTYETDKSLNAISGTAAESERIAKAVASVKPDLVIASQCD